MYCPNCECEYTGWSKCPECKTFLVDKRPAVSRPTAKTISYQELVNLVKEQGGQLTVELEAAEVQREKKWHLPRMGYGFAWVSTFQDVSNPDFTVLLDTSEVGRDTHLELWGIGFGFAWEKAMQGDIGGHKATLRAKKVAKKRSINFPLLGYGYAWTQDMGGELGEQLTVELKTTAVQKKHYGRFPGIGFGFAWPEKGQLVIKSVN
jgi:hypothetical protein